MSEALPKDELEFHEGDMPFSKRFGDHFYCRSDGRAECAHVFLGGNQMPERWKNCDTFVIGELGFGTGLNFLETWRQWKQHRPAGSQLHFVSFEAYPMDLPSMKRAVSTWPEVQDELSALANFWPSLTQMPTPWLMDDQTTLTLVVADVLDGVRDWSGGVDAWYLDGFAPSKNPDMWSLDLMQTLYDRSNSGATFASYTAAGWVRRNLAKAGFEVQKVPGFAGKREMIVGSKI